MRLTINKAITMQNITISPPTRKRVTHSDISALVHPRPSLTPGANPQNEREERLVDAGYAQGFDQATRLYRNDEDYQLRMFRDEVERIRKERGLK